MKTRVKLFAVARQLAGGEEIELELPAEATVADVRRALGEACPPLAPLVPRMMIAIDQDYAVDSTRIQSTSVVACIPPVSGG